MNHTNYQYFIGYYLPSSALIPAANQGAYSRVCNSKARW